MSALHIDLRRRGFIARARQGRPRLRQNLRQLGAVGTVVRTMAPGLRQAVVKPEVSPVGSTRAFTAYMQHAKGPGGQDAPLYGPGADDRLAFAQRAQQDPHQFRLMVSFPEYPGLDRTQVMSLFMEQVERDLRRPLDWVAANHYDTPHPHTHIVIRGTDRDGRAFYMERDYFTYGLRERAARLLTWFFGPEHSQASLGQQQEAQRLAYNGVPKGADDPDLRSRIAATSAWTGPDDDRPPGYVVDQQTQAQLMNTVRALPQPLAPVTLAPSAEPTRASAALTVAEFTARALLIQQALAAQSQAQQRGQGLGM